MTNQKSKQDLALMMNVLMKALGMMMMEVMTILVVMMTVVTVDEDEDDDVIVITRIISARM